MNIYFSTNKMLIARCITLANTKHLTKFRLIRLITYQYWTLWIFSKILLCIGDYDCNIEQQVYSQR